METKSINDISVISSQSSVEDYISLLKPRVMMLAVFTSLCGLWLAPVELHPFMFALSIFCISLGAGAAGAINMWFDRDIDSLMERTKKDQFLKVRLKLKMRSDLVLYSQLFL